MFFLPVCFKNAFYPAVDAKRAITYLKAIRPVEFSYQTNIFSAKLKFTLRSESTKWFSIDHHYNLKCHSKFNNIAWAKTYHFFQRSFQAQSKNYLKPIGWTSFFWATDWQTVWPPIFLLFCEHWPKIAGVFKMLRKITKCSTNTIKMYMQAENTFIF